MRNQLRTAPLEVLASEVKLLAGLNQAATAQWLPWSILSPETLKPDRLLPRTPWFCHSAAVLQVRLIIWEAGSESGSALQIFFSLAGFAGAGAVAAAGAGAGCSCAVPADASKNATTIDIVTPD